MSNKLRLRPNITCSLFIVLLLFILPVLTSVQAQTSFSGNVLIKNDGTIEPSSAPIQRTDETYTLLNGFTGNITIQRDNIILDGAGFGINSIITGTETTVGVDLSNRRSVTITGLRVSGFVQGISLLNSTNCSIAENNLTDNIDGIRIDNSSSNYIIGNNITANRHGVHPYQGNVFYHNNFVNSTDRDVYFDSADHVDTWDNGYPSGGNYWSNYTGVDEKKGLNQSDAGNDAIGDTQKILSSNNNDGYPLMVPYVAPQPTTQPDLLWVYVAIVAVVAIAVVAAFLFFRRHTVPKKQ